VSDARELAARIARTVVAAVRSMQPPDDLPPKTGAKEAKMDEERIQVMRTGLVCVKIDGSGKKGERVYLRPRDGSATLSAGSVSGEDYALLGVLEEDMVEGGTREVRGPGDVLVQWNVPAGYGLIRTGVWK
jgi:hypothetical protein